MAAALGWKPPILEVATVDRPSRRDDGRGAGGPGAAIRALRRDAEIVTRGKWYRWFRLPFSPAFTPIAAYRLNRAAYLLLGSKWKAVRVLLDPLSPIIRLLVPFEIDYHAEIGPGFRILHPQLGAVVNARSTIGKGLILAGGNVIGDGAPRIGDDVQLGVNAVVIGDVVIGDGVIIGAGAVVVHDFAGPGVLVGVPAKPV